MSMQEPQEMQVQSLGQEDLLEEDTPPPSLQGRPRAPTPTSSRVPSSDPSASQDPLSPPGSSAWLCLTAGLREKMRVSVTPGLGEEGADLDAPPLPASNGQHRPELPRPGVESAAPRP